ncbi:hypothetical protein ANAPC5_01269 [Anaplasma phagocytophilum]|nr:hypothetical protein ANAPC5_01269 [Anaplasma phagocytophilum]
MRQFLDPVDHKTVDVVEAVASKPALGKQFKKEAKAVAEALEALTLEQLDALEKQLASHGYAGAPTLGFLALPWSLDYLVWNIFVALWKSIS